MCLRKPEVKPGDEYLSLLFQTNLACKPFAHSKAACFLGFPSCVRFTAGVLFKFAGWTIDDFHWFRWFYTPFNREPKLFYQKDGYAKQTPSLMLERVPFIDSQIRFCWFLHLGISQEATLPFQQLTYDTCQRLLSFSLSLLFLCSFSALSLSLSRSFCFCRQGVIQVSLS